MRTPLIPIALLALQSQLHAELREWRNAEGRAAMLDLQEVIVEQGEKTGRFKMSNGRIVTLRQSQLSTADREILAAWEPPGKSVFDEVFADNLVALDGDKLSPFKLSTKPTKYYLFYYTASWCGPCHAFTPSLVQFYKKHKNDEFEVVLISCDRNEQAMEKYAKEMHMPWPQLAMKEIKGFRQKHPHPGNGIPNLVLCDLKGDIIKSSFESGKYLGPGPVLDHLGTLLKR